MMCVVSSDTEATADLRAAAHGAGIAARIALLTFAAGLALETLPAGPERDQGLRALDFAVRLAAGEMVDPDKITEAMLHEDAGLFIHHDSVCGKPEADAWDAVLSVLGYAAWQGYQLRGETPDPLVENYALEEALDWTINPLAKVPHLDWAGLARATAYVREHASKAGEGWGQPLRVDDLRRAAGR